MRVACLLLGWLSLVGAAESVDRRDPTAVARAWAAAIGRLDLAALDALATPDGVTRAYLRHVVANRFDAATWNSFSLLHEPGLSQAMLLPAGPRLPAPGPPVITGDTAVCDLSARVDLRSKLVLRQQADGTWRVDVPASLAANAGPRPTTFEGILIGVRNRPDELRGREDDVGRCHERQGRLVAALNEYAEEHDGRYPAAAGWMDAIRPYLKSERDFWCPTHPGEQYSYALSAALAGRPPPANRRDQYRAVLVACTGQNVRDAVIDEATSTRVPARHGQFVTWYSAAGGSSLAGQRLSEYVTEYELAWGCLENLERLWQATRRYADAHDGQLPAAATWGTDLAPLVQRPTDGTNPFVCPACPGATCTYAINREVAGRRLWDLTNWHKLLLFVETEPGALNAAVDSGQPPAKRHRVDDGPQRGPVGMYLMLGGRGGAG